MMFDDTMTDCEAQPTPTGLLIAPAFKLMKFLKNPFLLVRGNPWPVVHYFYSSFPRRCTQPNSYLSCSRFTEFYGVGHQVYGHLDKAVLVCHHKYGFGWQHFFQVYRILMK